MDENTNKNNVISSTTLEKHNSLTPNRVYVLKKLKTCDNRNDIMSSIEKNFFRASKYLDPNTNIVVGTRPDKDNDLIPYNFLGSDNSISKKRNSFKLNNISTRENSSKIRILKNWNCNNNNFSNRNSIYNNNKKEQKINNHHYDVIDDKEVRSLFSEIRNNINTSRVQSKIKISLPSQSNTNIFNTNRDKYLPDIIQNNLSKQQNCLNLQKKESILTDNLIKHLSKRTKKKEENILLNEIDTVPLKRHIIDRSYSQNRNIGAGMDPVYKWMVNLRGSQLSPALMHNSLKEDMSIFFNNSDEINNKLNEKEINNNNDIMFVNIRRSSYDPLYAKVKAKPGIKKEIILNPQIKSSRPIKKFIENPYLRNFAPNGDFGLKRIKSFAQLQVNGKNLLDYEEQNELAIKGNRKLFKTNLLESLEIPHSNPAEFEKNLSNILDDKVFVENYSNK